MSLLNKSMLFVKLIHVSCNYVAQDEMKLHTGREGVSLSMVLEKWGKILELQIAKGTSKTRRLF